MSLFAASLSFGLLMFLLGSLLVLNPAAWAHGLNNFGRSRPMAFIFFGLALLWFVFEITQLGEADFGTYRPWLLAIFGSAGLAAFYFIPDFLSVRGLAGLLLLSARVVLDAAYCQPYDSRLALVSGVYIFIVIALYLGAYPYRFRDAVNWLYKSPIRYRSLGGFLACYGLVIFSLSFLY